MDSKYLPSRTFIKKAGILIVLIIIVVLMVKVSPTLRAKIKSDTLSKVFVKDVVSNDSNRNGILDWEEKFWGLDPKGDGASNKEFINAKKKIIAANNPNEAEPTENDKLSREFFALVMSLQDSGLSNDEILSKVSDQIGSKVTLIDIKNMYSYDIVKTVSTSRTNVIKYRDELSRILKTCQENGMSSEMDLVGTALNHDDKTLLKGLPNIETAYRDCIVKMQKINVPLELSKYHLNIINNFEKSAQMLKIIENLFDDQITGLSAIVSYNEFNRIIIQSLNGIRDYKISAIISR